MKRLTLLSLALIALMQISYSQTIPVDSLYLGQTPPGNTPKVFAPGVVSVSGRVENVITFSSDSTHMFFSTGNWPTRVIRYMEYKDGAWTSPVIASFSTSRSTDEPSFSTDGKKVYYYAYLPGSSTNSDFYYSEKPDTLWESPVSLGSPLNSANDEYHPCVVNDSSVYFTNSSGAICRSQYKNGIYENRIILSPIINVGGAFGDAYVSPNESYIIYNSKKSGGYGGTDLYISFKKEDGSWTNSKNLGDKINTSVNDYGGDITPDGKYMTFGRDGDIYWVSANFIDSLKNNNFVPYLKNQVKDQTDTVGHPFSYSIPDSTFIDDDGNNTITYSATLSDGSPLPVWLSFDPVTRTFSDTLSTAGSFLIKVSVTDTEEASASCEFTLNVVDKPSSISQIYEQNIKIYPNPAKRKVNITFGVISNKNTVVEIINMEGKLIFTNSYNNFTTATIDLNSNPKGIYLLKLAIDGEIINKKICLK